jgi:RNA-binding protein YlmH
MDEHELLKRRILELAERAASRGYPTHTAFIPLSEQNVLKELEGEKRASLSAGKIGEAQFLLYGGSEESESKVLFFYPDYCLLEEEKEKEEAGATIVALHIEGKKAEYAQELSHRDYLGALMSLGYEREQFGDILVAGKEAYVFLFAPVAEEVKKNLLSVSHTSVKCSILAPRDCPFHPQKEERKINVSSPRLDAVVAEVFSLSREEAQRLIEKGEVLVGIAPNENTSYLLKGGEVIAVRGKGKFAYLGEEARSRKGRLFVKVSLYH